MTISGRRAYELRRWAKTNPGLHPMIREWNTLIDETLKEGGSGSFPTTTTTTTTTSTTTSSTTSSSTSTTSTSSTTTTTTTTA